MNPPDFDEPLAFYIALAGQILHLSSEICKHLDWPKVCCTVYSTDNCWKDCHTIWYKLYCSSQGEL